MINWLKLSEDSSLSLRIDPNCDYFWAWSTMLLKPIPAKAAVTISLATIATNVAKKYCEQPIVLSKHF